jgi:hypothetical protein
MRAKNEDAQIDCGMGGKFTQRPIEMAVVGAGGGDDADASLGGRLAAHGATRRLLRAARATVAPSAPMMRIGALRSESRASDGGWSSGGRAKNLCQANTASEGFT